MLLTSSSTRIHTAAVTAGWLLILLTAWPGNAAPTAEEECVEVVSDEEYHCHYRPIPREEHDGTNLLYLDTKTQWHHATNIYRSGERGSAILAPLTAWGWRAGPVSVSPDLERILVARAKQGCPSEPVPGPGLRCSYGNVIPWLAEHRVVYDEAHGTLTDRWVHINILKRHAASPNASIHGWSTWLHRDLALFNGMIGTDAGGLHPSNCPAATDSDDACDSQAFSLRFGEGGAITVEPFARGQGFWQPNALTGRISAQPPRQVDRCFDGQRVSIVRRHYDDPHEDPANWAWFNSRQRDGSGGACRLDLPTFQVPVLRTYVFAVDDACRPKLNFGELRPVRTPPDQPIHRQLSLDQEWGDMLSSISPEGDMVVMATNIGDPSRPEDNCAAFSLNLRDSADPLSGIGMRFGHTCRLGPDGVCQEAAIPLLTGDMPPHTALPALHTPDPPRPGIDRSVIYSFNWKTATTTVNRIARVDMAGDKPVFHEVILDHADYGHTFAYGRK